MRIRCACIFVAAVLLCSSGEAAASMVAGYGETDYEFSNRRECCEVAAILGQDDGAAKCRTRGGQPQLSRSVRGSCKTNTGRDGRGRPIYACSSTVKVNCR